MDVMFPSLLRPPQRRCVKTWIQCHQDQLKNANAGDPWVTVESLVDRLIQSHKFSSSMVVRLASKLWRFIASTDMPTEKADVVKQKMMIEVKNMLNALNLSPEILDLLLFIIPVQEAYYQFDYKQLAAFLKSHGETGVASMDMEELNQCKLPRLAHRWVLCAKSSKRLDANQQFHKYLRHVPQTDQRFACINMSANLFSTFDGTVSRSLALRTTHVPGVQVVRK